ncbi:AAA family ATPase [Embleya sp. NPDC020630]|uniref:AAA family ATPase n=1 Tax=Embleya sp. NPDC020630 TaxID=3363979 RepID=UPI0037B646D8
MELVERAAELTELRKFFDDCAAGVGGAVLISGPVAVGKTRLMEEFCRSVDTTRTLVLAATAAETEHDIPLGLIRQLLGNAMASTQPADSRGALFRCAAQVREYAAAWDDKDPRARKAAIEHLCADLLAPARDRTVVICLDDLHLADSVSVELVLSLQRRSRMCRTMLLLGVCTTDPTYLSEIQVEFARSPRSHTLCLSGLTLPGVSAALRLSGLPEARALSFLRASGGNPLLLDALLTDAVRIGRDRDTADIPKAGNAFRKSMSACLYRLDDDTRTVLRAWAVLGRLRSRRLLRKLLGPDRDAAFVERAMAALAAVGILDHTGDFRIPETARIAVDTTTRTDRADLHLRVAVLLHEEGLGASVIAEHVLAAGDVAETWISPVLIKAAGEALAKGDADRALTCAERAHQIAAGRAAITALVALVRLKWLTSPSSASSHLRPLQRAMYRGRLDLSDAFALVAQLVWERRYPEAANVARWLDEHVDRTDAAELLHLRTMHTWLRLIGPMAADPGHDLLVGLPQPEHASADDSRMRAVSALVLPFGRNPRTRCARPPSTFWRVSSAATTRRWTARCPRCWP